MSKTKAWSKNWITTKPDGTYHLKWETNDDMDDGSGSMYASLDWDCKTMEDVACHVYGQYPCNRVVDHSWYGWAYGTPVYNYIDGKLLPFQGTQPDMD